MAKQKEEYDPSLIGIILTAVLGSLLGLLLAGINTAFLPIKTVKELPALEDREKKMVYYAPEMRREVVLGKLNRELICNKVLGL